MSRVSYHDPHIEVSGTLSVDGNTSDFSVGRESIRVRVSGPGWSLIETTSTGVAGDYLAFINFEDGRIGDDVTVTVTGPGDASTSRSTTLEFGNRLDDVDLSVTGTTESGESSSTSSDSTSTTSSPTSGSGLPFTLKEGAALLAAAAALFVAWWNA